MSNQSAAASDAVLDALGDPMRRRITEALRDGPKPVGRIADGLPIGRPAVSKHLGVLETAGVVTHESVGTRNLYALAPGGYAALQVWLTETWDAALAAYRDAVEASVPKEGP
ncbi:MAG: metalloregulator ArsR/SmtB family transcription factor [Protaetiibacter sp.]